MSDDFKILPDEKEERDNRMERTVRKARLRAQVAELREGLMAGASHSIAILELLKVQIDYDHFKIWEDDELCKCACQLFDKAEELLHRMSSYPDDDEEGEEDE